MSETNEIPSTIVEPPGHDPRHTDSSTDNAARIMESLNPLKPRERSGKSATTRENLIKEFKNHELGDLNIQRAEDFMRAKGLRVTPFIIYTNEDIAKIEEITKEAGYDVKIQNEQGVSGNYNPFIDLVFIYRDTEYEAKNGTMHTERILVHELAHGSNMHKSVASPEDDPTKIIFDDTLMPPCGIFLEEAFAEGLAGEYIAQFTHFETKGEVTEIVKRRGYSLNDTWILYANPETGTPMRSLTGAEAIPMPLKYIFFTPDSDKIPDFEITAISAFPAFALDLLEQQRPGIKDLLIQTRTSQEAVLELVSALNAVQPGLCEYLFTQDDWDSGTIYTYQEFFAKFKSVVELTRGGFLGAVQADRYPLVDQWKEVRAYYDRVKDVDE